MHALSQILEHKIVAIIRGFDPADVLQIAKALNDGGISILEVTMNSPDALKSVKKLSDQMKDKMLIGAGTVLDTDTAKAAIDAGAEFIISPCFDHNVVSFTKKAGIVSIPGAFTPTEIVNAYNHGADIIKVFPSSGASYISEIRAPLSHIPLMPTGGITRENMHEFFRAGAVAVGIGNALVNKSNEITSNYLQELSANARQFVELKNNFSNAKVY